MTGSNDLYFLTQPNTSSHCGTTYTGTNALSSVLAYVLAFDGTHCTHKWMARLS